MGYPKRSEPRAHHYVPQCWLAGFTDTGQKDGRLWVADFMRQKQWPSTPVNTGHRRDFYRISDDASLDPVLVEKFYSKIENTIGPVLKSLDQERRGPSKLELEALGVFMALQWTRVPAFRPTVLAITDKITRDVLTKMLDNRASWARALKKMKIPPDSPGADYQGMRDFLNSGQYDISAESEWYVQKALESAQIVGPLLMKRHWQVSISRKGSFIGSDNPVVLDGERGVMIGFANAEVIIFPVSRHVVLHGYSRRVGSIPLTEMLIARANTMMMLHADEQVFSGRRDFCWLDEQERYQTDWTFFDKRGF